jgi:hypothetical protein
MTQLPSSAGAAEEGGSAWSPLGKGASATGEEEGLEEDRLQPASAIAAADRNAMDNAPATRRITPP